MIKLIIAIIRYLFDFISTLIDMHHEEYDIYPTAPWIRDELNKVREDGRINPNMQ